MKFKKLAGLFSLKQKTRYESRHDLLTSLAHRWNLRTYNRNLSWFNDADFLSVWKSFPEATDYIHERKFTLFNIARSLRHVPGDIAECGVFRAGSSFLMLAASKGTDKHLYGFDSFEGLSTPGRRDFVGNDRTFKWKASDMAVSEEVARRNLSMFEGSYSLFKGWIPERFPKVNDRSFSLVHIDVDLYEPTMKSLEFFAPRMSRGGVIVCDDYGFESCPGARLAMDEYLSQEGRTVVHLTTGQGFAVF